MENNRRVVITGMGVVSPYGVGIDMLWDSLTAGKSAIDTISSFDPKGFSSQIAAEVKNFNPFEFMSKKEVKRYDKFLQYAKASVKMCIDDAKIEITDELSPHFGVSIGSGIGGMNTFEKNHKTLLERGPSRVSPFFIPMMLVNMASGLTAIDHNLKGPNLCMVTACATGAHNIGISYDIIRTGQAKLMLAGGSDSSVTPLTIAGFSMMKAISSNNSEPWKASRPFDLKRDGFVMGEGSAILLLEELEHAKVRGAKIYAELVGFGMSSDAYHITQPDPEGSGAVLSMKIALERGGILPEKIDYINAHGTSTPLGDIAETKAIRAVFGDHADKLAVSSTKSMTGHLLGAAGAMEAIISILTIINNLIPPTINQEYPDSQCNLDYVPNVARKKDVNYVLSNSFGFGGTNSVIVFKKYSN